jgi:endonuclease/exonuclease/phosphatase family metal-dependent hydrolase
MRRIAPAMGLLVALPFALVPAVAGNAATAQHRASRGIGLDTASSAIGTTFVSVSWRWARSDTAYQVQISPTSDFSTVAGSRKVRSSASRPPGGRQATTLSHLEDATYYYVRVRRTGASKSSWSSSVRVATLAHLPDKITDATGAPGAEPGSTQITWSTGGAYTDYFKVTTATTPFGTAAHPGDGRSSMTWRVPGTERSLTLTPDDTAAAGAPLGSGRNLFFRVVAVRSGEADSKARAYPYLQHAIVSGEGPTTTGSAMRFATYNVHVADQDPVGHKWADRAQMVADNIAAHHPAVVALSEMVPSMWTSADGGPGLQTALSRAGASQYRMTRDTSYGVATGDARILYDPTQVTMTSVCDPTVFSCGIQMVGANNATRVAAYARFRDLATGQEFYFVALHFDAGNNATTDALRGREAQTLASGMAAVDTEGLPVVVGGDFNSSQLSNGVDAPHTALLDAGYYNTEAAATQVGIRYSTVNNYQNQAPSPFGFGSMYDSIMTLGMPGATRFEHVVTQAPFPSDHNLVLADLRLP